MQCRHVAGHRYDSISPPETGLGMGMRDMIRLLLPDVGEDLAELGHRRAADRARQDALKFAATELPDRTSCLPLILSSSYFFIIEYGS